MAKIIRIDDWTKTHQRQEFSVETGTPIADYLPKEQSIESLQVIYNGKVLNSEEKRIAAIKHTTDIIIIRALPSDPVTIITIIASIIVSIAISYGTSLLMKELYPPEEREDPEPQDPVYGWDGITNTTRNGTPIAAVFGHHKVGGQFLSTYTKSPSDDTHKLYALLGLSAGPVCQINTRSTDCSVESSGTNDGLTINDNPIKHLSDVEIGYRMGSWTQERLVDFDDVIVGHTVGAEISDSSWYTYTTNEGIEAVELIVSFPNGLYRLSNSGKYRDWTTSWSIQYKLEGAASYTSAGEFSHTSNKHTKVFSVCRIELPQKGKYSIQIKHSGYSTKAQVQDSATFKSINEITYYDIPYKGVALLGVKAIASENLNGSLPKITSEMYGKEVTVYHPEDPFAEDSEQIIESDGKHLWGWSGTNLTNIVARINSMYRQTFATVCEGDIGDCHGSLDGPFYYKSITGDFDVRVKTEHKNHENATDYYLSGGLLVQSQDDSSDYIYIFRYNDRGSSSDNYGYRTEDAPNWDALSDYGPYLRMVRSGSTFTLYGSSDGSSWTQVKSYTNSAISDTVNLGFALTSYSGDNAPNGAGMNFSEFTFEDSTAYSVEVSDNPAWVIYHILTDTDWGLGDYIDTSKIDLDTFIAFADYANELAKKGDGTYHKRYCFDGAVSKNSSAWEEINRIAGLYDAKVLKQGDRIRITYDAPKSEVQVFSVANIVKDSFKIAYQSKQLTANYWEAKILDETNDWETRYIPYIDPSIGSEPYRRETIKCRGITRPQEAQRKALRACLASRLIKKKAEFDVGIDAVACEPGDRIEVQHHIPEWGVDSGRVVGGGASTVTIDKTVTLEPGTDYQIKIRHQDDTIETQDVANIHGDYREIKVASWDTTPQEHEIWVIGVKNILTKPFVVTSIERNSDLTCKIKAIEYNEDVYSDDISQIESIDYSLLPDPRKNPPDVEDIKVSERNQILNDGTIRQVIDVTYTLYPEQDIPVSQRRINTSSRLVAAAKIYWRENGSDNWKHVGTTSDGHFTIESDVDNNTTYDIAVCATSPFGQHKSPDNSPQKTIQVSGSTDTPSSPTNVRITRAGERLTIAWDGVADASVEGYEIRYGTGSWGTAQVMGTTEGTEYTTTKFVSGRSINWMVKSYSTSGIYSSSVASVTQTLEGRLNKNIILTQNEVTSQTDAWPGTKNNMVVDTQSLKIDQSTTDQLYGEYTTATIDAGASIRAIVECHVEENQIDNGLTWGNVSETWGSAWAKEMTWGGGASTEHTSFTVKFRYGNGPTDTDLGNWEIFVPGEYKARYFQFKVECTTDSSGFNCQLEDMEISIDAPDITAGGNDIYVAGSGTTTISFSSYSGDFNISPQFVAIPNANHTAYAHGDTIEVVNVTKDEAEVKYRDSAGSQKEGYINFISRGY